MIVVVDSSVVFVSDLVIALAAAVTLLLTFWLAHSCCLRFNCAAAAIAHSCCIARCCWVEMNTAKSITISLVLSTGVITIFSVCCQSVVNAFFSLYVFIAD